MVDGYALGKNKSDCKKVRLEKVEECGWRWCSANWVSPEQ